MNGLLKKEHITCSTCTTKSCFVQQFCMPTWVGTINQDKNLRFYRKGEQIFREGDRMFGLYFIQEGKVKVVTKGPNGRTQISRWAIEGHILGHLGTSAETYAEGAIALEDTWLCFVDNSTLRDVFKNNPKFTYGLMMFYSAELQKTEVRLRYLAQMSLPEKVAECLLCLKKVFGENKEDGSLNVILSRWELADFVGASDVQVIRALTAFENDLLIKKTGKKIILLNVEGLLNIISAHNINKYFTG